MTIRRITAPTLIFFGAYGILAQPTANPPAFVSATIQPSSPYARGSGFRAVRNHIVVDNQTLKQSISVAYNLPVALVSGGPSWIDSARYDMVAEVPPATPAAGGASPLALSVTLPMFQTLLTERFKLQFHREQTAMPLYNLVIGQNGLHIAESTAGPRVLPSLFIQNSPPPRVMTLPARNTTMAEFASVIQRGLVNKPVVDKPDSRESTTSICSGRPTPPAANQTSLPLCSNSAWHWCLRKAWSTR
jgi:uncharacterized protein (TIGR03435 family)